MVLVHEDGGELGDGTPEGVAREGDALDPVEVCLALELLEELGGEVEEAAVHPVRLFGV